MLFTLNKINKINIVNTDKTNDKIIMCSRGFFLFDDQF